MDAKIIGLVVAVLGGALAKLSYSRIRRDEKYVERGGYTFWGFCLVFGTIMCLLGLARIVL